MLRLNCPLRISMLQNKRFTRDFSRWARRLKERWMIQINWPMIKLQPWGRWNKHLCKRLCNQMKETLQASPKSLSLQRSWSLTRSSSTDSLTASRSPTSKKCGQWKQGQEKGLSNSWSETCILPKRQLPKRSIMLRDSSKSRFKKMTYSKSMLSHLNILFLTKRHRSITSKPSLSITCRRMHQLTLMMMMTSLQPSRESESRQEFYPFEA